MRNRPQRQRSAFSVLRAVSAHRETAERNVCIVWQTVVYRLKLVTNENQRHTHISFGIGSRGVPPNDVPSAPRAVVVIRRTSRTGATRTSGVHPLTPVDSYLTYPL